MIKTIQTPSGKEIRLSNSAAFLIAYKNQFNREPLKDIMSIQKAVESSDKNDYISMIANMDLEVVYNLAWALAKLANNKIGTPMEFYQKYDDFLPLDHIDEVLNMSLESLTGQASVQVEEDSKN